VPAGTAGSRGFLPAAPLPAIRSATDLLPTPVSDRTHPLADNLDEPDPAADGPADTQPGAEAEPAVPDDGGPSSPPTADPEIDREAGTEGGPSGAPPSSRDLVQAVADFVDDLVEDGGDAT
jgi:hypothetical protein